MAERDIEGMDAEALRLLVRQLIEENTAHVQTIAALKWVRALALLCLEEERRPRGAACSASLRRVGPHPHDRY